MAAGTKRRPAIRLDQSLVLNRWVLGLFDLAGPAAFQQLSDVVRSVEEGTDENNVSYMAQALQARFPDLKGLRPGALQEYDNNIVSHTIALNARRAVVGEPIRWKYFQYLTLLFVEIYLDRFFNDPEKLRADLNETIEAHNSERPDSVPMPTFETTAPARTQLNKIALWSATGSGKTLLMHANLRQYEHYARRHNQLAGVNRRILLTPNEGLSAQHLKEFAASGLPASRFDKNESRLLAGSRVDIVEVTKLATQEGDKTVDVAAFESNNLVLVDEGHRGASGDRWMQMRNRLCSNGFSFEYSATFGQAVADKAELVAAYGRSVLVDYSYRWFYSDGFGKDHQIFNLDSSTVDASRFIYLVGSLLSFYEQLWVFDRNEPALEPFGLEKPLMVFVGSSVTAGLRQRDGSDIVQVLRFLAEFVQDREKSEQAIDGLVRHGFTSASGEDVFADRFGQLVGRPARDIFDDLLRRVFNADAPGTLRVENLAGVDGEISLRIGTSDTVFGVVNVGDDAALTRLCEGQPNVEVARREFSGSLFGGINDRDSSINVLIGSKKFTEGWNSWRVSAMGLLNVGRSEGSQIIQLFGRGVRLRGLEGSLKRSAALGLEPTLAPELRVLETLSVFGVNADYMETFRGFLEGEGVQPPKGEVLIPVRVELGDAPLTTIGLAPDVEGVTTRGGHAFRKVAPLVVLRSLSDDLDEPTRRKLRRSVGLNWYPKLQSRTSLPESREPVAELNEGHLTANHVALLDIDSLISELHRFKTERGWYNLVVSRDVVADLLADNSWYVLKVPSATLALNDFANVAQWQLIAAALLKCYLERFYSVAKQAFELPLVSYRTLELADPNLLGASSDPDDGFYYRASAMDADALAWLERLSAQVASQEPIVPEESMPGIHVLSVDQHVYAPLLAVDPGGRRVGLQPVPLDRSEAEFVRQLRGFVEDPDSLAQGWDVKFMRNLTRGKGVGFYEAGGYYPDFVVWISRSGIQHLVFIDPKGMRNLGGTHHPKVAFHREIKALEDRLAQSQPGVHLHSYLISVTPEAELTTLWNVTAAELLSAGVVFEEDPSHLEKIFAGVLGSAD